MHNFGEGRSGYPNAYIQWLLLTFQIIFLLRYMMDLFKPLRTLTLVLICGQAILASQAVKEDPSNCSNKCLLVQRVCYRSEYGRSLCSYLLRSLLNTCDNQCSRVERRVLEHRSLGRRSCYNICQGYFDQCLTISDTEFMHIQCIWSRYECKNECKRNS